jgi:hypothetical protein
MAANKVTAVHRLAPPAKDDSEPSEWQLDGSFLFSWISDQRSLLNSATRISRSFGSSGASVSFVIASAFGAAFSAIC